MGCGRTLERKQPTWKKDTMCGSFRGRVEFKVNCFSGQLVTIKKWQAVKLEVYDKNRQHYKWLSGMNIPP